MVCQFMNIDAPIGENSAIAIDIANARVRRDNAFQSLRDLRAGHARHVLQISFPDTPIAGTREEVRETQLFLPLYDNLLPHSNPRW
jgi:hypothetical protein